MDGSVGVMDESEADAGCTDTLDGLHFHKERSSMKQTDDLRVRGYIPLEEPAVLKRAIPITHEASETVSHGREAAEKILRREDKRLMAIVGPCSIHDEQAALVYAERLNELREKVSDTLLVMMRVYFEKPRTTIGWKGLINDPRMDGSCDMMEGLRRARALLLKITEMGLPTATEMLEPITPQYLADLVSWGAIGARTTESQTHREMASGLSMPVGFKNSTDGSLSSAINAIVAAGTPQSFLGIDQDGRPSIVQTGGNPWCHIVLRGGRRPNYDPISIERARLKMIEKNLPQAVIVDCSHDNSLKKFQGQAIVWKSVVNQYIDGNDSLVGLMLESNLHEGNQKFTGNLSDLKFGVSITDECISWETTQALLLSTHETLKNRMGDESAMSGENA